MFCFALYAPGLASIPPLDRDEARFAQASRQMLESGDFLRIRFQHHARDKKPAGIYWLEAASVGLFSTPESTAIWPYRLPSAVGAGLAALLTLWLGLELFPGGSRAGLLGAVMLASSLALVAEAHIAKTDAALLAATVAAEGALGLAYIRSRSGAAVGWGLVLGFWVAEAIAILLKGPVVPAITLLTAGALAAADREARWLLRLRPLAGFALLAAFVLPWLIAIETATGGRFLSHAVGHDLLPKLLGGQEAHGAWPGTYLLLALLTFWPGSLVLVPALVWGWRQRREAAERFLLAWLVPGWIMFELVPTKLPHYVLPLYPALALLAGRAIEAVIAGGLSGRWRIADRALRGLWAVVTLTIAAALVALPIAFGSGISAAGLAGASALALLAAVLLMGRSTASRMIAGFAGLAAVFALAAAAVLPGLDRIWLSRTAAALVARHPPARGAPTVAVGYSEPSLVFLLGTKTRLLAPSAAARALAHGGAALVSDAEEAPFRQATAQSGLALKAEGRAAGLDYSDGRRIVLTLYDVRPR